MALTFNANDICFYQGSLYKSSANTNLSHVPLTSSIWWTLVTGAGGGGGVNFIANSLHSADTSSWAEAPSPIGIYTFNWATDVNLFGGGGLLTVFNGSVKTSHSYIEGSLNTIQPSQLGQSWKISLAYELDGSANFGPTDLEIGLYDVTNDVFISAGLIPTTLIGQVLNTSFFVYPTTSTSYRLRIRAAAGSTTCVGNLRIADVSIAPQVAAQTPAIGSWQPFPSDPISGDFTKSVNTWFWRRVGDSLEISGRVESSAAGTELPIILNIPFGLTIDLNKTTSLDTAEFAIGVAGFYNHSVAADKTTSPSVRNATQIGFIVPLSNTLITSDSMTNLSGLACHITVPIASWSSSIAFSTEAIEYASNDGSAGTAASTTYTTGQVYGPSGSVIPAANSNSGDATTTSYAVDFLRPLLSTDEIKLQVSEDGVRWMNVTEFAFASTTIGNWSYGVRWSVDPSIKNRILVQFGNGGAYSAGAYQSGGVPWSAQSPYRWRAVKRSGGSLAEVPSLIYARVNFAVGVANLSSPALISFLALEEDTHNAVVLGTPFKFTAPVSGRYQFNVEVCIVASASTTSTFVIALSKNEISQFLVVRRDIAASWTTGVSWLTNGQRTLKLNAGDYISVMLSANVGANLSVSAEGTSYCEVVRLGN
jgi:hypothetical protein